MKRPQYIDGGKGIWLLAQTFIYHRGRRRFEVPQWFTTDFRSVNYIKSRPETNTPALIHDWDYLSQHKSRLMADWDYMMNCLQCGCSKAYAIKDFIGLRLFGWVAWRQNARHKKYFGYKRRILNAKQVQAFMMGRLSLTKDYINYRGKYAYN